MGRILTLQVEIADDVKAGWIWHSHMDRYAIYGVHVTAIQEGPISKEEENEFI